MYNTYLKLWILVVEQHIVSYQCRTPLLEPNQSMRQMSRWPDLDILLSHYRRHHCFDSADSENGNCDTMWPSLSARPFQAQCHLSVAFGFLEDRMRFIIPLSWPLSYTIQYHFHKMALLQDLGQKYKNINSLFGYFDTYLRVSRDRNISELSSHGLE